MSNYKPDQETLDLIDRWFANQLNSRRKQYLERLQTGEYTSILLCEYPESGSVMLYFTIPGSFLNSGMGVEYFSGNLWYSDRVKYVTVNANEYYLSTANEYYLLAALKYGVNDSD